MIHYTLLCIYNVSTDEILYVSSDESFPSAQFNIDDYEIRNRRAKDKHRGRLIEFVKKGFITKRTKGYETK